MPGIVEFPKVVLDALTQYDDIFANECQRRHFAEYLTGLMVAERKTVLGINGEFAETTDQSCLNRFLTDAVWDVQSLNQRRVDELQKDPSTRYSDQGVIAIDNTLIDRDGLLIPDAGWFWDHAEGSVVYTDEYNIYDRLTEWGYDHRTVCHARAEYARDDDGDGFCEVHVNTLEGFWSLLRSWLRPHRGISQEKLPLYLGFFEFIHNVRARGKSVLGALIGLLVSPPRKPA